MPYDGCSKMAGGSFSHVGVLHQSAVARFWRNIFLCTPGGGFMALRPYGTSLLCTLLTKNIIPSAKETMNLEYSLWTNIVRTYSTGAAQQQADILNKWPSGLTSLLPRKCEGQDKMQQEENCKFSGKKRKFGCDFVVGARLRRRVSDFHPTNERIGPRISAKFLNISPICALKPTDEKEYATKKSFYAEFDRCSNGLGLISFTAVLNMVVRRTELRRIRQEQERREHESWCRNEARKRFSRFLHYAKSWRNRTKIKL